MPPLIGTAGWAIPAADRSSFPEDGTALQRYAAVMPCLEVNSSFHRPHRRSTWERWAASVPDGFRFSAKIPKEISHVRRLVDATDALGRFLGEASGLGGKLSVILLQLPPSFPFDAPVVSSFLAAASSLTDARIACEPRHASWFTHEADALLVGHEVARVAADPARVPDAARPGGWRGLTYRRMHGSPVMYRSAYGEERLRSYANEIEEDLAAGRPTWCIFDNTASSAALGDALNLIKLLEPSSLES
ncbi:DUF72 domain-containing protein [Sphingomonas sp. S6]|jgi:uncharacterized protein YecE (DUF72 family)|uniref:DUF72 domain-containing protein n=1 Tax=Sphingomonas sp. S6 TaxID=3368600 RepID=UPI000F91B00C|nr:DUF72 domain-containing protein [uncultured Sphingomonas sp.]RTL23484.1 MAG: DUF72 domain-containing protein [Sphingomonadaceae bacterium]